jgi:hypothetical protein
MSENLIRANKVTAYWEGDGVAVGVFYKTHSKLASVRSTDESVINAGFVMPEGTDEAPVTAAQKLEAFKNFICANAAVFGIAYDPVDRRDDTYKFPNRYDENNIMEYAAKMLTTAMEKVLASVQSNVVDRMVKSGLLPEGSEVQYGIGDGVLSVTEKYGNGYIKYATVTYPVAIAVNGTQYDTTVVVDLVSGQIKKPRTIGDTVMTMSGVKEMLVTNGVLPKVEKKAKDADAEAEAVEGTSEATDAPANMEAAE